MAAAQLRLLHPDRDHAARWASEGRRCARCEHGQMYMVHPSDPCTCAEATCICLAEGYARCDSCGTLEQVFPREMVMTWVPGA